MSALEFSRNYFNVCNDFRSFHHYTAAGRALLGLKIASYFTVVIPIGVGIVYAVSKHSHNVQVIHEGESLLSSLDEKRYDYGGKLLVPHVKKVCSAAKKQFRTGNKTEAYSLLNRIKYYTDQKSALIMEHLNSLVLIAKTQLKMGLEEEAYETIRSIVKQVPELSEISPEMIKYLAVAEILIPFDSEFANEVLDKAADRVESYEEFMISRYGSAGNYEAGHISQWYGQINTLRNTFQKN